MTIRLKAKNYAQYNGIEAIKSIVEKAYIAGYEQGCMENTTFEKDEEDEAGVNIKKDGFILWVTYHFFNLLRYVSVFQLIRVIGKIAYRKKYRRRNPNATKGFIDKVYDKNKPFPNDYFTPEIWVCFNLLLAILGNIIIAPDLPRLVLWIIGVYAILRIFEIFIYQINALLFDPIKKGRKNYKIKSATRMVILLFCNILEYILWFSILYTIIYWINSEAYGGVKPISVNSLELLANISNTDIRDMFKNHTLIIIAYVETIIGIFVNILFLARVLSLLPSVATVEEN